ncbi:vinorine synthase-like protein [Trifolium pratense]|uniref:Vinorine synthase-like protein n=1 Tax=Trifolium pratense TaxID=57577 RepID=A0A2K3P1Y7_TRIPR|nr:vinorine synthase-like protein [Trifolium pratense]
MVYKRFVFEALMVKSLKKMVTNSRNSPTRVQVVTALIYRRAVSTMGLNFKTAQFSTVVDLCRRMVPPFSWRGFPIYEVDFGWGKPTWVTTCGSSLRNLIFMMYTRDGFEIEAYVNMEESDMARFENDAELLKYASLNPSTVGHDS